MKKNKMMRLASALLVCVLLSTSVISGTFAKYVTSDTASDSARVAKWGISVEATGSLYGEKYASADSKITALTDEASVSVWGKQGSAPEINAVVAPGTKSDEGFQFGINGKAEVDALVTVEIVHQNIFLAEGKYGVMVEVTGITEENFEAGKYYKQAWTGKYIPVNAWGERDSKWYALHDIADIPAAGYWPVVYSLAGSAVYDAGDTTKDTLKAVADLIAGKVGTATTVQDSTDKSKYTINVTKNIEQNVDIAFSGNGGMDLGGSTISWVWTFDGGDSANKADTILGNLMAERLTGYSDDVVIWDTVNDMYIQPTAGTHYCLDNYFSIEMTVEQVD